MGFAFIAFSLQDRRRSCITSGICTGFLLLLLIAGADCWPWGSDPWCPPGTEPKCPINPLTDQENYFPHPTDCHYYIQCDGSRRPICRPCSSATYFSTRILNCVWPIDAACPHNDTTSHETLQPPICGPDRCTPPGKKKRDYSDCTHYFICINETFEHREECPKGKHFNTKTNECDNQCTAGCIQPCDIPECDCRNCVNTSDPYDCRQYHDSCTNTLRMCEGELKFNPKTGKCSDPCKEYIPRCECQRNKTCENISVSYDCKQYRDSCTNRLRNCEGELKFNPKTGKCSDPCKEYIPRCECQRNKTCENISVSYDCKQYRDSCTNTLRNCEGELKFNPKTGKCSDPCKEYIQRCECQRNKTCENISVSYDCKQYRDSCTNTLRMCEGELKFNPKTGKCSDPCKEYIEGCPCYYTTSTPPTVDCTDCANCEICYTNLPKNYTKINSCEFTRHQKDCQLYYNDCSRKWSRCPGNLHFNEVTKSCDHPCNAGCKDPKDITECCTIEGEVFEDPCSCNTYYICRNGIKEIVKCEDGLQYNIPVRRCDKSCSCNCDKLFAGKPECCASTGGKPEPQCPVTTYPIFMPHPTNGQFFYTCLNGVRSCSRCPLQHRWNIDTDTCDGISSDGPKRFLLH